MRKEDIVLYTLTFDDESNKDGLDTQGYTSEIELHDLVSAINSNIFGEFQKSTFHMFFNKENRDSCYKRLKEKRQKYYEEDKKRGLL